MKEKPKPKKEIAILFSTTSVRSIIFHATKDAAEDMADFGRLTYQENSQWWSLFVDSRYDFDEVLKYIEEYGEN